ncbi:MAG: hypothetical protein Q7J54_01975 [Candidatus Woesearchaeota archaeon]|nr:hypothetical protein [Candidatus Woesearchaeota archaeon]
MKYNLDKFNSAVEDYKKILKNLKNKSVLIYFNLDNKKAYYSIAPLSKAIHELGGELNAVAFEKSSSSLDVLKDVWQCFRELKKGIKDKKTIALKEFIDEAEKKAKGRFIDIFNPPELILEEGEKGFKGMFKPPYYDEWFVPYRFDDLIETAKIIWNQVYDLKKGENVSIGFETVPKEKDLELPLEDYLDSYAIAYAMMLAIKGYASGLRMGTTTSKMSMLEKGERISELRATLLGCELDKEIDEPVFVKFKKLSELLKINRLEIPDATFSVRGKGYGGKHLFGEVIGYPTLNKKSRWSSPGQIIYKLDYYPQTKLEDRDPKARVGFTETLPIDVFIESCRIDWLKMKARDDKIREIVDKSDKIIVSGESVEGGRTEFEVGMIKRDGGRRKVRGSDVETRNKINQDYFKETGIKAGTMANIPGGEAFMTPEYLKGTFVGDVVISLDQSYMLSEKNPLVVECYGDCYKVLKGDKAIIEKFEKKKKEAWKQILEQEKNKSLPFDLIKLKKDNFNRIGEFAINTNPNAKLCNYLIVNEKIANMIHIALGSGFEADRATEYHTDIVIDAPRQKLDIYGIDKKGNKLWILKKGKFVV